MAMVGAQGSNIVTGAPQRPDNTGRDWGEGAAIGATTAGAVIGSILSFGTAAAPLAAAAATADAAIIGARAYQDVQQNDQDNKAAQRQQQAGLDAQMKARQPQTGSGAALKAGASPTPGPQVAFSSDGTFTGTSDRRAKTNIGSGVSAVERFLEYARNRGALR